MIQANPAKNLIAKGFLCNPLKRVYLLASLVAPTLLVSRLLPLSKDVFPLSTRHMVTSGSALEPVFCREPAVVQLVISSIPAGLKESANKGEWYTETNAGCCLFHCLVVVVLPYKRVWGKN